MVIFELNTKKDSTITRMYEKAMKELDDFFSLNWNRNRPNIILMKDRKTIDAHRKTKTPLWLVGWVWNGNIHILDKDNYEKESSHKYSPKEYFSLMKHELAHLFYQIVSNYNHEPDWLWEGTALFLDGSIKGKPKFKGLKNFLGFYEKEGPGVYKESGFAVQALIQTFGKQKFLRLIKSLSQQKNKSQFNKLFKKIYGKNPTYIFFNDLLK